MTTIKQHNLAIIFGGKSPEHEVSIVTAFQVSNWINRQKYQCYFIYLDRENTPFLCPALFHKDPYNIITKVINKNNLVRFVKGAIEINQGLIKKKIDLDSALLLTHGGTGENGELQGTLDFFNIPYTGSNVLGSALGMDKVLTKDLLIRMGFNTAPYYWFNISDFNNNQSEIINRLESEIKYPAFVKPASSGSSIGISKVTNRKDLIKAINLASSFDNKILVEKSIENAIDINCAVIGENSLLASVCEQPIFEDNFLSFKEKYLKGGKTKGMAGLSRIIPAPIPQKISDEIRENSKIIFKKIVGSGMARIDFLYQKKTGKIYPNEINTIPGSLAYYLWEASGIKPQQLIERLVELAQERKNQKKNLKFSFESKILDQK